jgi:hypothetical protein
VDIPTYLYSEDFKQSQSFFIELCQTLLDGLSNNGFTVPQVTDAFLTSIAPIMPDGTLWYVTDSAPPIPVMKVNGALMKFTMTAYP